MSASKPYRVDLHLHSYASNVTDYYAANAFAIPESYSDPIQLHRLLKQRGMALVTLTDHNSIDGGLAMLEAGLEDVFLSAEMTTTFPEDGCNIHVTVANVTPLQFAEVQRARGNIYEMIAYLDEQIADEPRRGGNKLAYFMTHPLMSTQNRPYGREGALSVAHIEKALLLCNCIEVQNGSRTRALNDLTRRLLGSLDRRTIESLADRHNIEPRGPAPWHKAIVGGSDDHSGLHPGRTWTEFACAGRPAANDLVEAIRRAETRPGGAHGGPITLAHSLLKLLHDGSRRRGSVGPAPRVAVGGSIQALLGIVFEPEDRLRDRLTIQARALYQRWLGGRRRSGQAFEQVLESEVHALLAEPGFRATLGGTSRVDDRIFLVVGTLINRILVRYLANLREAARHSLLGAIKEGVALLSSNLLVSLPYLVSFLQQSSDSLIARDVRRSFDMILHPRIVLLTDTLFEINGVSATIKRMIREATAREIDFTVVTCLGADEQARHLADPEIRGFIAAGRLKLFESVTNLDFPEYDGLQIRIPPVLEVLRYLQESGFTKVQISTPGTIGLTGLLAAKVLQLESAATYHTSIPEYVEQYTRDVSLEALAWKYMLLFYHAVDEVLVPSRYIARLLHRRGLRNRKLLILDRWVDVDRFHPRHRTPGFWSRFGVADEDSLVKFVYVGRLGVEKNLHLMAAAYRLLRAARPDAHLILVGDGPYRRELEGLLRGLPVTFTGFLEGAELSRALASADVKLFPSTTDTWGNAPLEAQASGVPVIVSDIGGPAELMDDGVTGLKVAGRDVHGLHGAMAALMDPALRCSMGRHARAFAEANRVDRPFSAIFDADGHRQRLQQKRSTTPAAGEPTAYLLDLGAAMTEFDDSLTAGSRT